MFKLIALASAATLVLMPTVALAWGQTGHRVTGAIAEQHLSRSAAAGVKQILGSESLAEASTWPDFMRASQESFWREVAPPFHYVTVPKGKQYAEVGAPPEGDGASALRRFSATIRDPNASLADKQIALRFIVHIIGDLHQPLHAGDGTDRGGNDAKVTYRGRETNLHSVWDSGMIEGEQLSYSEKARWLAEKITPEQARAWRVADPEVWIQESTELRDQIYPAKPVIDSRYAFQSKSVFDQRLSQAGVRIAAYLNALFARAAG